MVSPLPNTGPETPPNGGQTEEAVWWVGPPLTGSLGLTSDSRPRLSVNPALLQEDAPETGRQLLVGLAVPTRRGPSPPGPALRVTADAPSALPAGRQLLDSTGV